MARSQAGVVLALAADIQQGFVLALPRQAIAEVAATAHILKPCWAETHAGLTCSALPRVQSV